ANRLYVQAGIYDACVERLAERVQALVVGDGAAPGITQGPLITKDALAKVERLVADATHKGATAVTGGRHHALGRTFYEPTVLAHVTAEMDVARQEIFGPVAPVFRFEHEDEVIAAANDTQYGLAAYFYARDVGRIFRVAEALEYGMVGINSGLLSSELVPFGGVKESGNSREGGRHGIDEFVETKYMLIGGLDR
ncbi:MAG: aldehyde dehydrogenase family protein, partial [Zavarzinia sp.]|nr:aldehyde dehydrogenase family protein [Zavarzinia sp.]